ncbi:hypothetical protein SEA_BIRTHDAYBOY_4 [Gordonia phage BirthdayBoy]|uniref:Minor tail protein n=1 Tax=Gordonia phage BirthdayBoy TaxID=3077156 RepID=A0AA96JZ24_9CAUD|nr:hypothetical protein SEA_BIRTHDAYBOY_4 [Gordonia phage BirthdayBoy]
MANVWYIGDAQQRAYTFGANTFYWNVWNGWSLNESNFTADQLQELDADPGFLLGQTGPRTNPPWYPDPVVGREGVYLKAIQEIVASLPADLQAKVAGLNLLEATDPRLPDSTVSHPDFRYVETDQDGRISRYVDKAGQTWLKLHPDSQVPRVPDDVKSYGYKYAVTDSNDKIAFAIGDDGKVLIPKLNSPGLTDQILASVQAQLTSGPAFVFWGDSMTAGAGGNGTSITTVLQSLVPTATIYNRGVGGENSVTITCRSGAVPLMLTVAGNEIPASGAVNITLQPIDGVTPQPLLQGGVAAWNSVTVAGVAGAISLDSGQYKFTRATAGTAVSVPLPVPALVNEAAAMRAAINVIWIGQNGPSDDRALGDVDAIIQEMTAATKRFIVMSKPTSTDALDTRYQLKYGRRFISPRKFLVQHGLSLAGITPTTQDTADIAAGTVPSSLRVDSVHWTAAGYTAFAQHCLYPRLKEFGWI